VVDPGDPPASRGRCSGAVHRLLRGQRADRSRLAVAAPPRDERQREAARDRSPGKGNRLATLRQGRLGPEHAAARGALPRALRRRGHGGVRFPRKASRVRADLVPRSQRGIASRDVGRGREAAGREVRRADQPIGAIPADARGLRRAGARQARAGRRRLGSGRSDAGDLQRRDGGEPGRVRPGPLQGPGGSGALFRRADPAAGGRPSCAS
jgi:hypothetical protein